MKRIANISAPTATPIQNPPNPFPAWRLKNGVMNAGDNQLGVAAESCERWTWACGGLVVLGLIAEFALAIIHPSYDSFWDIGGSALADALIALGVGGEVLFARMGFSRQGELQRRSAEYIEELRHENLELTRTLIPRQLTDEHVAQIAEKIKPFAGTPFEIETEPGVEYDFVNKLLMSLQIGKWNFRAYSANLLSLPIGVFHDGKTLPRGSGVQLRFNNAKYDEFLEPSKALAHALTEALRQSVGFVTDPKDSPLAITPDAIRVEVYKVR